MDTLIYIIRAVSMYAGGMVYFVGKWTDCTGAWTTLHSLRHLTQQADVY